MDLNAWGGGADGGDSLPLWERLEGATPPSSPSQHPYLFYY